MHTEILDYHLGHSFIVRADRDVAWVFLWDLRKIARCIPGCRDVVAIVDGEEYRAHVRREVGPFRLGFDLRIKVVERVSPAKILVEIEGIDRRLKSRLRQTLTVNLVDQATPGTVRIDISATLTLSGLLASLAKTLVAMQVNQSIEEFAAAMKAALEERTAASSPHGVPAPRDGAESELVKRGDD